MVMWLNTMRYIDENEIPLAELQRRGRTPTDCTGKMQSWRYLTISPDKIVHATPKGRRAQEIWRPLAAEMEDRWSQRFGIDNLRGALERIDAQLDPSLSDGMRILGYGLISPVGDYPAPAQRDTSLPAMLAHLLLSVAIEFESKSPISLAICANVLRVLDEDGVRVAEIPVVSGVSKESIAMAMGILTKHKLVSLGKDAASRAKIVRLTSQGIIAQEAYRKFIGAIEKRWEQRFGGELKQSLLAIEPRLFAGLEPYPDNWRAKVRRPEVLPHFPMVLHRGGYPDGA
jgi:hypothetical protein